jgi:creatinine amidohydrolase
MKSWLLEELTYKQVKERSIEVAILPIGACEPHGYHLPYGTDGFEAYHLADRVGEAATRQGADVVVLPTLGYGVDANMSKFPLAIDIPQTTLNRFVKDVIASLRKSGIHKLVIFNSHGGNGFKPLLRELVGDTSVFVSLVNWWQVLDDVTEELMVVPKGDHAHELEAAVMLVFRPDLVRLEDAGDGGTYETLFPEIEEGWVSISRPWHLFTKDSSAGDPRNATAERGQKAIDVLVERVAGYVAKLAAASMDDRFPYGKRPER